MGSIKNPGKYLEFSIEGLDYYPWQDNIFSPDFKIVDGHLELPHKPGWGVEINQEWLSLANYHFKIVDGHLELPHKPGWGVEINQEWLSLANYQVSYTGSRF